MSGPGINPLRRPTPPRSTPSGVGLRSRGFGLLACALLAFGGCTQRHYLVRTPDLPLYAAPTGSEVLARLPLFHHEPISASEGEGPQQPRVAISYRGLAGFAAREGLVLFDYLDPVVDEGEDRDREVQAQLRAAQVEAFGADWSSEIAEAVRRGAVIEGMTARQVEVSWGWPSHIERGSAGEQRWIYVRTGTQLRQVYRPDLCYAQPHPTLGPTWGSSNGWTVIRERYEERRVLTLGPEGRVKRVEVTRTFT